MLTKLHSYDIVMKLSQSRCTKILVKKVLTKLHSC